jgi:hypothetical protein
MRTTRFCLFGGALASALALSCGGEDFDPASKLTGVRILAVRSDKSFAKPGDTVNLEMLAVDARAEKPRPMNVAWIPFPCVNPPRDLFYLCFGGVDPSDPNQGGGMRTPPAGASMGAGPGQSFASIPPGTDLTPLLPPGPKFSFQIPAGTVVPRGDGQKPYGLVLFFHVACAGRIVSRALDPNQGPQATPIACVDENGAQLPPSDYVLGISRVYVYDNVENQNPEITGVNIRIKKLGQKSEQNEIRPVDLTKGIVAKRCLKDRESLCNEDKDEEFKLEAVVPPSSQELNPIDKNVDGSPLRELVWSTFFTTGGRFGADATLLYDSKSGKVDDSSIRYLSPTTAQTARIYLVVRDNRGGVNWIDFPATITD